VIFSDSVIIFTNKKSLVTPQRIFIILGGPNVSDSDSSDELIETRSSFLLQRLNSMSVLLHLYTRASSDISQPYSLLSSQKAFVIFSRIVHLSPFDPG
jgi:hypothetical protein